MHSLSNLFGVLSLEFDLNGEKGLLHELKKHNFVSSEVRHQRATRRIAITAVIVTLLILLLNAINVFWNNKKEIVVNPSSIDSFFSKLKKLESH